METVMEDVKVIVPCPSCARPMGVIGDSWQCLACHPIPADIPICATVKCKKPLTKLPEPWNCWICLKCNRHPAEVNKERKEDDERKRVYLDVKVTKDDVAKMVADGIAEAMAKLQPAYPPTTGEITQIAESEGVYVDPYGEESAEEISKRVENNLQMQKESKPETYMQKAKRLGVSTHIPTGGTRKKADIEADIAMLEKEKEVDAEAEEVKRKAGMKAPSDNDEFARGLTEADMMN